MPLPNYYYSHKYDSCISDVIYSYPISLTCNIILI